MDKEDILDGLMVILLAIVFPPAALMYAIATGGKDED